MIMNTNKRKEVLNMLIWQALDTLNQENVNDILNKTNTEEIGTILHTIKGEYEFYIVVADNGSIFDTNGNYAVNLIAINVPEDKWNLSVPSFKEHMASGKAYIHAVKCVHSKKEEKEYIKRWKEMVEKNF